MNNYQQGAEPQNTGRKPKTEVINKVELTGIIRARGKNENDPIKVFNFDNGGACIHAVVKVSEYSGKSDAYGNPEMKVTSVPINVFSNSGPKSSIPATMLQNILPGSKVHVVGHLAIEKYQNRQTNQWQTNMVVNAFVFEILEQPMQPMAGWGQQYAPTGQYPQQPQAPQYPAPQYPQQYGQPAPVPGQAPYAGAPAYAPAQSQQVYYPQQAQPQPPVQPGYGQYPQPGQQVPYYRPGPQQQAPAQAPQSQPAGKPAGQDDDMPDFGGQQEVRDINI